MKVAEQTIEHEYQHFLNNHFLNPNLLMSAL